MIAICTNWIINTTMCRGENNNLSTFPIVAPINTAGEQRPEERFIVGRSLSNVSVLHLPAANTPPLDTPRAFVEFPLPRDDLLLRVVLFETPVPLLKLLPLRLRLLFQLAEYLILLHLLRVETHFAFRLRHLRAQPLRSHGLLVGEPFVQVTPFEL